VPLDAKACIYGILIMVTVADGWIIQLYSKPNKARLDAQRRESEHLAQSILDYSMNSMERPGCIQLTERRTHAINN
jgi:hypothetical protein